MGRGQLEKGAVSTIADGLDPACEGEAFTSKAGLFRSPTENLVRATGGGTGQGACQDIELADETGDLQSLGLFIQFKRRAGLGDSSFAHHRHLVSQREGLILIMGDDEKGEAQLLLEIFQLDLHLLAQALVERPQGLIQQEQPRFAGEGTGKGHALALATGELVWPAPAKPFQMHEGKKLFHLGENGLAGQARHLQPETDIGGDGEMREEGIGLEHHVDGPLMWRQGSQILAVEQDCAAVRALKAGNHAHDRALAAAGGAEQCEEAASLQHQGHIIHRLVRPEGFADSAEFQQWRAAHWPVFALVQPRVMTRCRRVSGVVTVKRRARTSAGG